MKNNDSYRLAAIIGFSVLSSSCINSEIIELRRLNQINRDEIKQLSVEIRNLTQDVEAGFRIALCRPEIRQLIDDVQQECYRPEYPENSEKEKCSTKQIHPAVISADPEHKGRFLKLMSNLRHEVVYLRPGATEITRSRRDRLWHLARQPLLKSTRFLVVVNSNRVQKATDSHQEDIAATRIVTDILQQLAIPPQIIMRWIYSFPINTTEIESVIDRPTVGEPAELTRSVWIFRIDC